MTVNRIFWGTIVICLGLLWLFSNLGLLPSTIWYQAWRLWPILIILWGFSILFSKSSVKSSWFSITTLLIIGIVFSAFVIIFQNEKVEGQTANIKERVFEDVESAHLIFALGAVNFSLSGGSEYLLEGQSKTFSGVEVTNTKDAGIQTISLKQAPVHNFIFGPNLTNIINLKTNSDLPLSIDIDSGASKIDLDLREVRIESLDIDSGATSSAIVLGDNINEVEVNISSGASDFNVKIPTSFAIKVKNKSGLSGNNFNTFGLKQNGDTWISQDYGQNDKVVIINFESGVSNLNIEKY